MLLADSTLPSSIEIALGAFEQKLKFPVCTLLQPGLVSVIGPPVAPAGTVAEILCALLTVKLAAGTPLLKVTPVTPLKFTPAIVTTFPGVPIFGVTLLIAGQASAGAMLKLEF